MLWIERLVPCEPSTMILDAGKQLAEKLLQIHLSPQEIVGARLSDLLQIDSAGVDSCLTFVERLCADIPLFCLKFSLLSNQEFSDLIYQRLDKYQVDFEVQAKVLIFFRGFCSVFFHSSDELPQAETQPRDPVIREPQL
jgi:hypothetical protein